MFLMRLFSSDKKKSKLEKTESKAEISSDSECYTIKPWSSLASAYGSWLTVNSEQNLFINVHEDGCRFLDLTQAEFDHQYRLSDMTAPVIPIGENEVFRFKWYTNRLISYQVISDEHSKKTLLKEIDGKFSTVSASPKPGFILGYDFGSVQLFKYDENTLLFFGIVGQPESRTLEPEGFIFDLIDIKTMRSKNRTFHPFKGVDIANTFFDNQNRIYLTTSSSSRYEIPGRGIFDVHHGSARLLCYQFNSVGQAKKVSDVPLSKQIEYIWPSPVANHLLVAFEVNPDDEDERCQLFNCEMNKGSLIKKEKLGDVYASQIKNIYVMPNGQVIYPEIKKDDKVNITSASLISGQKKVLTETNSKADIFVKSNGEYPQVGVISYADKTRKLYPLEKDEPKQKAVQFADKSNPSIERKEDISASLTPQSTFTKSRM